MNNVIKKELAVVFGITSNLTFALGNVLIGLKKHSPDFADEIVVYHDGIPEADKSVLGAILPCRFIEYEFPIKDLSKFNSSYFNQFSKLAYARYECFNLLDEYQKVLWLDVDILIQNDISAITEFCKTGFGIIAGLTDDVTLRNQLFSPIEGYDMTRRAYSSGTFIIADNFPNYKQMTQWCYDKTYEFAEFLYLPDQAVLNLLIQHFEIDAQVIDLERFCCHPTARKCKNALILHSYRPEKFWNFWSVKEWNKNYKEWVKLGGSKTKIKTASLLSRSVNAKWPDAPDPLRKPRHFALFIFKKLFKGV